MRRKPQSRHHRNRETSISVLKGLIFKCHLRLRSHLLPFVSALIGCFLFVFSLLAFLSPPINHHRVLQYNHNHTRLDADDQIDPRSHENTSSFLVPRTGERFDYGIWTSNIYYGCSQKSEQFKDAVEKTNLDRFLMITTSGGLNQQRTWISDAVVAAYILNSTLVVPKLDNKSYRKDQSNFSDIFDVEWFMSYLSKDVSIVKELPMIDGRFVHPHPTRIPRKCDVECYESRVLPLLEKKKVVMLTKFDYMLSNNLHADLQKLRCRVNYHALRYTNAIREMGKRLVERMRIKSEWYIALHLRFESDMLAFSGCNFGGGDKQRSPDKERREGRYALTPEEVGLLLRALGYGDDAHIYVASGDVYGDENTLLPLKQLFPNTHSKDTLATKEELAPFASYSSRMSALDFIVSNESDVFATNNNGNMAKTLAGTRRYFGHKPTIRPNFKKLYRLFLDRGNMTWEEFASQVRTHQSGFMGRPNDAKSGKGEFYEDPTDCICVDTNSHIQTHNQSQNDSQSQSEANTHIAQDNISDPDIKDHEQVIYKEHNVCLTRYDRNEKQTLSDDLPIRSKFVEGEGRGEECHLANE